MQNSLCDFRQPRSLLPLMYEAPVWAHGCNMYGLFSSHLFVVLVANVMYCQTGTRHQADAGLKHLLSTSVSQTSLAAAAAAA